jgi:hypothetical protein
VWTAVVLRNVSEGPALPPRPTGWHAVYLVALLAVVVAAALLRHARIRAVPAVAAGLALAVAVGAWQMTLRTHPSVVTQEQLEAAQSPAAYRCERAGAVEYCAFHGYQDWIAHWRGAVEPVVAALPDTARAGLPRVRQMGTTWMVDPDAPREVLVPSRWGRFSSAAAQSRADLAGAYAIAAVGLSHGATHVDLPASVTCQAGGQARLVVALWLAAQALPDGATRLDGDLITHQTQYGGPETDAARALLARPRDDVRALLSANWSRLTDPAAGFEALGLPPAPSPGPDGPPCH